MNEKQEFVQDYLGISSIFQQLYTHTHIHTHTHAHTHKDTIA